MDRSTSVCHQRKRKHPLLPQKEDAHNRRRSKNDGNKLKSNARHVEEALAQMPMSCFVSRGKNLEPPPKRNDDFEKSTFV
jgi:hypothetical protein